MPRQEEPARFSTSRKGYDRVEVDEYILGLETQLDAQAERMSELDGLMASLREHESDLKEVQVIATKARRDLKEQQRRSADLEEELKTAREQEDAVRLMLSEASKTRDRMVAEGDAHVAEAVRQSDEEAGRIIEQALDKAEAIKAAAQEEVGSMREHIDLEVERLQFMSELYRELEATLHLVANTSIDELLAARRPLDELELPDAGVSADEPEISPDGAPEPNGERGLPHLGDEAAREAFEMARSVRREVED